MRPTTPIKRSKNDKLLLRYIALAMKDSLTKEELAEMGKVHASIKKYLTKEEKIKE